MEQEIKKKRGDRGTAVIAKLKSKTALGKDPQERLDLAACTLKLFWENADKAFRHTAGCATSTGSGSQYFNSPKRIKAMAIAEVDFEKTLQGHLEKYAKKKGLFFPSEAAKENNEAKLEAVRRGLQANKRSKDDVLIELNLLVDAETDTQTKLQIYKTIADIDQMKKAEVEDSKGLPSVVCLPPKNNITMFGVEMYVDPSKKAFIEREFAKIANPKKFGIIAGEED